MNEGDKAGSDCVLVFDGSRAKVCADISFVLSLKDGNVIDLFKQYQDFESARDKLLRTYTDSAAISTYNQFSTDEVFLGYKKEVDENGKPTGKKILLYDVLKRELEPAVKKAWL